MVDPWFIASSFLKILLIKTAREVNIYKETVINKILKYAEELETKFNKKIKIGCYGCF